MLANRRILVLTALVAALSSALTAQAAPGGNRLIRPDKVEMKPGGKVVVSYSLPCKESESATVVMTSDDSGDREVAVGVVAALDDRSCTPGIAMKSFRLTVDAKKQWGYDCRDGECSFHPMNVESEEDRKLEAYVRSRLSKGPAGEPSVQSLIDAEAKAHMELRPETLRCMGYRSWERNGKVVGSCHIEAVGKEGYSHDVVGLRANFAILVGDDTEHPGGHRWLRVEQISYSL